MTIAAPRQTPHSLNMLRNELLSGVHRTLSHALAFAMHSLSCTEQRSTPIVVVSYTEDSTWLGVSALGDAWTA